MRLAITRGVSAAITRCELTHLARHPIDLDRARAQHAAYEACLRALGCTIQRLLTGDDLPDSVFVEDCAVVWDEIAVIARPGASSRRAETGAVEAALKQVRPLGHIEAPATLDGGDVLKAGRAVFVGLSSRTNAAAIEQLQRLVGPFGYTVTGVEVRGCLHLKSAVTEVAPGVLLLNPAWIPERAFPGLTCIAINPGEPYGANALRIGDDVVYPSAFPRTRDRLESLGLSIHPVDVSELAKAEGAVTCCSVIVETALNAAR
jgi:dimethylargininase